jgi:predicted dehydrogenase
MKDGMTYAPRGKPSAVVKPGEFVFAATALDHGHVYGQTNGLLEAGAELRWVYDPDPTKVAAFVKTYPQAKVAPRLETILDDPAVRLVAAAAVPSERGPLGLRVMDAGKDYFTDKCPFTSLDQLAAAREKAVATGRKYMVYYSERLHVECAVLASQLIEADAIGRIVQTIGTGPHRIGPPSSRPAWFYQREKYGGILCDIGSHQSEQFLHFTGATDATVNYSAVGNYANSEYPELEDFGEASLTADNGASGYYRVDWLTPEGLRSWGDGRTFLLGTKGYIELRKYINVTVPDPAGEQLYIVDEKGEHHIQCAGKVGFPFFGALILDCLNRTEHAMTQSHAFKAAELSLRAQAGARRLTAGNQ